MTIYWKSQAGVLAQASLQVLVPDLPISNFAADLEVCGLASIMRASLREVLQAVESLVRSALGMNPLLLCNAPFCKHVVYHL